MRAYGKDISRTIRGEKKRLLALTVITALGVTMMCGLKASCDDLRASADRFFDDQKLHDIAVVSTLGLTEDDVTALQALDGVEEAQGVFSQTYKVETADGSRSAAVRTFTADGIDCPYVLEGRLPEEANEIAVTSSYLKENNKHIGDSVVFNEDGTTDDSDGSAASDPDTDYSQFDGLDALSESSSTAFTVSKFRIVGEVIDVTAVDNGDGTMSFRTAGTDDYSFFVLPEAVDTDIYTEVVLTVDGARNLDTFSDAYTERIDALTDEIETLVKANREAARTEEVKTDSEEQLDEAEETVNEALEEAKAQLDDAAQQLEDGREELTDSESLLEAYRAKLGSNADKKTMLDDAQQEIEDGWAELEDGQKQYDEGLSEYNEQKANAEEKLADARETVNALSSAVWYVQDRTALSGYSDMVSDANCIEAIGTVFPVMFLTVAVLISLTTINRMVEENRGLIGTYQALGFYNREIRRKYMIYSGTACLLGGAVGNFCGFIVLPDIIFIIFRVMYLLPAYTTGWNPAYGIGGILLFGAAVMGCTAITCRSVLKEMPASLMRPRPPKSGSRILLEHIHFIWRKLSFLNKITARNLFRYKKRFLMTVFGIAGCTGLLICGFAIKDTVADLMPRQYDHIISYDLLTVNSGGDDNDEMCDLLNSDENVGEWLNLEVSSVHLKSASGDMLTTQMYVIPDGADISDYVSLDNKQGAPVTMEDDGFYITENAGTVLNFSVGDTVTVQDLSLNEASDTVQALIVNYLGNSVYISQSRYEELFGDYEPNAAFINLTEDGDESVVTSALEGLDGTLSITSVQELRDNFSSAFLLMNIVVYVVIVLAGALAFVVLFTLSTTNISERERELATIKVLGFYDNEVHRYVNKETLILTGIGVLCGLPLGKLLAYLMMMVLKLPSVNFAISIHPVSYMLAACVTFVFALFVEVMTNRVLNRIDPVEALKSVE